MEALETSVAHWSQAGCAWLRGKKKRMGGARQARGIGVKEMLTDTINVICLLPREVQGSLYCPFVPFRLLFMGTVCGKLEVEELKDWCTTVLQNLQKDGSIDVKIQVSAWPLQSEAPALVRQPECTRIKQNVKDQERF